MEKVVYLIWGARGDASDALRDELLTERVPRLLDLEPRGLSLLVDDSDSQVRTPMPWPEAEPPLVASVSLWLDCHDRRGPFEEILAGLGSAWAGYLVSESLYTDYGGNRWSAPRDWPDGKRSPGVVMLTLLERPAAMPHADWIAHWHGVQSPVSEEIQPRMRYVRQEVVRGLTPGGPRYDGIVEEAWPSAAHVEDPLLFYCAEGSQETLQRNLARMLESVQGFLELDRIRSQTLSEYLLRT